MRPEDEELLMKLKNSNLPPHLTVSLNIIYTFKFCTFSMSKEKEGLFYSIFHPKDIFIFHNRICCLLFLKICENKD